MTRKRGTTLVTGASAGIGAALARTFAERGHDLVLVARTEARLEALARELASRHGAKCTVIPADLASDTGPDKLCDALDEQCIEVEILVNNAGIMHEGPFAETPLADHQKLVRLNMGAVVNLTHRLLGGMVDRHRGRILNVASTSAFYAIPRLGTYAASKAFLLSFSEALSVELSGTGVTVTALCPGFTETGLIERHDGQGSMRLPLVPNTTAEEVALAGYAACMKGTPVEIVGAANRLAAEVMRRQPRWLQRAATGLLGSFVLGPQNGASRRP